ncbi:MAG TPA: AMP-binding protein [Solirubrobacteraceae bacterium]|nr:AMP-binding protein [Solirubrobacteraceae bacterium]
MSEPLFPALHEPDDREAMRIGERALSYRELSRAGAAVAGQLAGASRIAVWAEPTLELCVAVLGALGAGVPIVPINPGLGPRELGHIVNDSTPERLVAWAGVEPPEQLAGLERIDVDLTAAGDPDQNLPGAANDGDGVAFVMYTSGTTGPPKGVQIPRRAIATNLDALAEIWQWTAEDRVAQALPVFHVHGLILGLLGPLRRGGSVEHVGRFSPGALAEALSRGVTMVFGVPTMYTRIARAAAEDRELAEAFGQARLLISGSAALPTTVHDRIKQLTGQSVLERYGLTETLMNTGTRLGDPVIPGRVGQPLPGVELKLIGEDGSEVDATDDETIGEVAVRGPNLFDGYLNRPDATEEAMRDGWFMTGDMATRNSEGSIKLVGRKSTDMIKSGGYRIGAGEIEGALLEHPAVAEVAVAARPDEDLGERIVAWVVLEDGQHAEPDELSNHVANLLTRHKRPREVNFVDELPRNAMGKVMKRELPGGGAFRNP